MQFLRAKIASSFKLVRNPCDIAATNRSENRTWFTRVILKLQLWARQKLHRVSATKIACVNGPLEFYKRSFPWQLVSEFKTSLSSFEGVKYLSGTTLKHRHLSIQYYETMNSWLHLWLKLIHIIVTTTVTVIITVSSWYNKFLDVAGKSESKKVVTCLRLRVPHVEAAAHERRLYSQAR